jgi:transcriptional/translational regulatory protein YebC/TACO1
MEPKSVVEIDESQAGTLMRMLDALDDHDDVEAVHANFDIPDAVLERATT